MVCCLLRTQSETALKAKVEALASWRCTGRRKGSMLRNGWIPIQYGATNGTATEKLVAALEGMRTATKC